MGLGKLFRVGLSTLSYKQLLSLYPKLINTNISDIADDVLFRKFFLSSQLINNKVNLISQLNTNPQYMCIKKGLWDYRLSNFCFVKDMLANIIWCVEQGYIPIIDIYPPDDAHYSEPQNLWELFYQQPLSKTKSVSTDNLPVCPITTLPIRPSFDDARNTDKIAFWHEMLETFVIYNEKTKTYLDSEYNSFIKGRRVLACVLRSTDYTKLKPKGHPVQPSVEEVFAKLHEVMEIYPVDYIYLATEDFKIADAFKNEFPNRILENKRNYFNEQFDNNDYQWVSQVHFNRENDDYLKMLEYISSINLVSKCDYLVTGLNGGSEMAIYRNGNKYKYTYVFDKGVY